MTLRERLTDDLKAAMRGDDPIRRDTLRLLLASLRKAEQAEEAAAYERCAAGKSPEELDAAGIRHEPVRFDDDGVLAIIRREVKQRHDSIAAYQKAGRSDLAAREEAELRVLSSYLPQHLDRDAIAEVVRRVIEEVGASGPADIRHVMPRVNGRTARQSGRARGACRRQRTVGSRALTGRLAGVEVMAGAKRRDAQREARRLWAAGRGT